MDGKVKRTEIVEILEKVFAEKGFTKTQSSFPDIESQKGEGYMGDVVFVNVENENTDGRFKHDLVVKCEKRSRKLREIMPVREAFANETVIYDCILPCFEHFQKHKCCHDDGFCCYPKCHATLVYHDMQIVVLENLKASGYNLWNSREPLSFEHVSLVIKELAKLHALSLAFKREQPAQFQAMAEKLDDVFKRIHKTGNTIYAKISQSVCRMLMEKGELIILQKIKPLFDNYVETLNDIGKDSHFSVIVHGDCWINNFLFQYKDNTPISVALLDWQLSRIASPVIDLSFFLYSSCSSVEINHLDEILIQYHKNVSDFLHLLQHDPKILFPYGAFLNEWKKYRKFGLLMMPILLTFCLCTPEEAIDSRELLDKGTKIEDELFDKLNENKTDYFKRIYDILKHYINCEI